MAAFAALALAALPSAPARAGEQPMAAWRPSPGHVERAIWPGTPPDARSYPGPQNATALVTDLVAGKPWVQIAHVERPTMTVYAPRRRANGAAVVVFPGGGYSVLAIDLEGTEVCDWLTSRGMTCVLLKYRVPPEGAYPRSGPYPESAAALDDAQRTVGLVRLRAAELHVDPHEIGVLGFSAGGHLAAALSTHFVRRVYRPVDAADRESCRPDFAVAVYPGHLALASARWDAKRTGMRIDVATPERNALAKLGLNPDVPVTHRTPPAFVLQAQDDPVDDVANAVAYYRALTASRVPAELHLYPRGGHAFGLRRTNQPITAWPRLVETWLRTIGMTR